MIRRQKKVGNHSPPKNKLVLNSEKNEENGYPFPNNKHRE
jgi:hypothetical protein